MYRNLEFRDSRRNYITLEVEIKTVESERSTIDLEDITEYKVLAITGELREFTGGRPSLSCSGQIKDEMITKNKTKLRLIEIWQRWHLNDQKSGTRKQNECLDNWKDRPKGWSYEEDCQYLKEHSLYNDNGYRYGTAWLVEILPDEIMKEIDILCSKLGG